MADNKYWLDFNLIENYIYLYHLNKYIILPGYPDEISDTQSPIWNSEQPLLRTAPIQSYAGNNAREISVSFKWHRDLMNDINYSNSSLAKENGFSSNEDYVDSAIKYIMASQLPVYNATDRQVNPPIVAMKLGEEVYIKGVLKAAGVKYGLPMLRNNKYATIDISFTVVETEPYDAKQIVDLGSYRIGESLERGVYDSKYLIDT